VSVAWCLQSAMGTNCSLACSTGYTHCCNERAPTNSRCGEGLSPKFTDLNTPESTSYSSTHNVDYQDEDAYKSKTIVDPADSLGDDDKSPRQNGIWSFNSPPYQTAVLSVSEQHGAARVSEARRLSEARRMSERTQARLNEAVGSESTTGVEHKTSGENKSKDTLKENTDGSPEPRNVFPSEPQSQATSAGDASLPEDTTENTDGQKGELTLAEQQMKQKKKWRISFRSTKDFASSASTNRSSSSGVNSAATKNSVDEEQNKKEKKHRGLVRTLTRKLTKKIRAGPMAPDGRIRIKTSNANQPSEYAWLEAPLRSIASNKASTLGSVDAQTQKAFTPLFFVIGGCPNYFCGMQVIAYFVSSNGDGEVDFWWVKPTGSSKSPGNETEHATLCRHGKGPHKNDPGRSKPFYKPLADMFTQASMAADGRRYAVEVPPGENSSRAFIEEESMANPRSGKRDKLWLHLVWQEDWTTNPFSSSKYIKGKLIYQRDPKESIFFAREYMIKDGVMTFSAFEDQPYSSMLPGENIKELYEAAT